MYKKYRKEKKHEDNKQEGTADLGLFLSEFDHRKYPLSKKFIKTRCHDDNGGQVWRKMLTPVKKNSKYGRKQHERLVG